jgi:molybdate transport system substrate-binding protein
MKKIDSLSTSTQVSIVFCVWQAVLIFLLSGCSAVSSSKTTEATPKSTKILTVSAAISLKEAFGDIKQLYQKENPEINLVYNFGSAGSLQQQIEQGAPVDVFMPAAEKQLNALDKKGLIFNETRKKLLRNRLVLVTPKANTTVSDFQDLTQADVRKVALGEPRTVPAGQYTLETLKAVGLVDEVKPKAVFAKDVRQVLNYVATGNADAGFIYATDARKNKQVKVVKSIADSLHSPIVYPLAVLKKSKDPASARKFVQFLSGQPAKAIFQQYGFLPVTQ